MVTFGTMSGGDDARIPRRIAGGALLALALLLPGCAEVLREAERGAAPPPPAGPVDLLPLPDIPGGRLAPATAGAGVPLPVPGAATLRFVRPVALAARNNELAVADAGLGRVFRLDTVTGAMNALQVAARPEMQVEFTADRRLLVIEAGTRQVAQFSADGQPLSPLTADAPLDFGRPVDVATDTFGNFFVADALYRHVVKFHPAGSAWVPILPRDADGRGPDALGAVAVGARGLLLLDPACACVLLTTFEGRVLGRIGRPELVAPARIAVDGAGRLYVADDGARELRVYVDGRPMQSFAYRSFGIQRVSALRVAGAVLYIAGAEDGRIEQRRIAPRRAGAAP